MLGRERREARAVAGGLRSAVTPGRHARTWLLGDGRPLAEPEV